MTITIELTEEQEARLRQAAVDAGADRETFALRALLSALPSTVTDLTAEITEYRQARQEETLRRIEAERAGKTRRAMEFAGVGKDQPGSIGDDVDGYLDALRGEWEERQNELEAARSEQATSPEATEAA